MFYCVKSPQRRDHIPLGILVFVDDIAFSRNLANGSTTSTADGPGAYSSRPSYKFL